MSQTPHSQNPARGHDPKGAVMTASRQLAAEGHPGYGEDFAAFVIRSAAATGKSLHETIRTALRYWPKGR